MNNMFTRYTIGILLLALSLANGEGKGRTGISMQEKANSYKYKNPDKTKGGPQNATKKSLKYETSLIADCGDDSPEIDFDDLMVVDDGKIQGRIIVRKEIKAPLKFILRSQVYWYGAQPIRVQKWTNEVDLCSNLNNSTKVPFVDLFWQMKSSCPIPAGTYPMKNATITGPGPAWPGKVKYYQYSTTVLFGDKSCLLYVSQVENK